MFSRESYKPKTYTLRIFKEAIGIEVFIHQHTTAAGKTVFYATGWNGNRQVKPAFNLSFATEKQREAYVTNFIKQAGENHAFRLERRHAQNVAHDLKVGDILHGSWGCEQTNCEFYQVTEVPSANYVTVRKIAQNSVETGFMSGRNMPIKDSFTGEPLRRKVNRGSVKIDRCIHVAKWDGKPKHSSSYA